MPARRRIQAPSVPLSKMEEPTLKSFAPALVCHLSATHDANMFSHDDLPSWAAPAIVRTHTGAGSEASACSAGSCTSTEEFDACTRRNGIAPSLSGRMLLAGATARASLLELEAWRWTALDPAAWRWTNEREPAWCGARVLASAGSAATLTATSAKRVMSTRTCIAELAACF